jgi:hypothetical protein
MRATVYDEATRAASRWWITGGRFVLLCCCVVVEMWAATRWGKISLPVHVMR